jgi:RNA polymerase sigma factor (sigma-70 family)
MALVLAARMVTRLRLATHPSVEHVLCVAGRPLLSTSRAIAVTKPWTNRSSLRAPGAATEEALGHLCSALRARRHPHLPAGPTRYRLCALVPHDLTDWRSERVTDRRPMTTTRDDSQDDSTDASDVARLVQRAAAGNRWAWERLVDQYSRLIWAITRDFKLVDSDAADVAQATWLRLLEHIDRLRSPDRVGYWLAATARNECLRSITARKKVLLGRDEVTLEGVAAAESDVDERLLTAERAQMVREALSCLPWTWQQMLKLLMADPPASYAEISDQLGLPVGSIGPTRQRCLARLRVLLHASLADGTWQEAAPALVQLDRYCTRRAGCSGHLRIGRHPDHHGETRPWWSDGQACGP